MKKLPHVRVESDRNPMGEVLCQSCQGRLIIYLPDRWKFLHPMKVLERYEGRTNKVNCTICGM